jgi:phosphatidyl-myo-inositol alpha-mannosyltransferase
VEFTGFVKEVDKPRYYSSADIAVFPSSGGESFGIVLLEAMASDSKIVLGGNNPGYRCVLGDQPDLLFGTANPNELADKILNMLGNSADTKKLHEWQQNEVKKYDVNVVGPKLVEIYRSSIAKRRSTRHN